MMVDDGKISECELLIRIDERVENLTKAVEELTISYKANINDLRRSTEVEINDIRKELDWLKSKVYMGFGAIALITTLITLAAAIKTIFG